MELFATDRDRLAFLLETDAALDLDFEAPGTVPVSRGTVPIYTFVTGPISLQLS